MANSPLSVTVSLFAGRPGGRGTWDLVGWVQVGLTDGWMDRVDRVDMMMMANGWVY